MRIIEQFIRGKGYGQPCEDAIFFSPAFAAVIDGATDKSGHAFAGIPGGLFAARSIKAALAELDPDVDVHGFASGVSTHLFRDIAREVPGFDPQEEDGPSATIVVYSAARREVWRVGDASWASHGSMHHGEKAIDTIAAHARAALLRAMLHRGSTMQALGSEDPGRAMILPLLKVQHAFRNLDDPAEPLGFGAIDGGSIPPRYLERWSVHDATELILASDGYPRLHATLAETEADLMAEVMQDPLRTGRCASTKGVAPGAESFDDRAYLRFSI